MSVYLKAKPDFGIGEGGIAPWAGVNVKLGVVDVVFLAKYHEYAHALLHFDIDDDTERSKREAEAVAYVVGRYCGVDTSGSAFYLAAWESDDPEVVRDRLERISRTAEELIEVLDY